MTSRAITQWAIRELEIRAAEDRWIAERTTTLERINARRADRRRNSGFPVGEMKRALREAAMWAQREIAA